MSETTIIIYLVLFGICLLLSAFFSSSETAFMALQQFRLQHMVETKTKGANRVVNMMKHPEKLLSTVLLGNNLVNTAATALATTLAVNFWPDHGIIIATVGVTLILLIFCETTPKTIAAHHAERMAITLAPTVRIIAWLLTPFVIFISWFAAAFSKLTGSSPVPRSLVSDEEIRTMISVGHRQGTMEEAEAEMLHKVFDFGDRPVRVVMIPRTEVVWLEQGTTVSNFLKLYAESPISRFPVYQENSDNVVGILSVKDVLMSIAKGNLTDDSVIDDLLRPAYFAPETKRVSELFAEMRDKNYRMAVIVDEYGGIAGVVSLSRLLEEIVGPMGDELSDAEKEYEAIDEHTFQIDGGMNIDEANSEMDIELPDGDYETVAGFMLSLLGHIPTKGEHIKYRDLKLVITEMQGVKIASIKLTKEKHAAS